LTHGQKRQLDDALGWELAAVLHSDIRCICLVKHDLIWKASHGHGLTGTLAGCRFFHYFLHPSGHVQVDVPVTLKFLKLNCIVSVQH